MSGQATGLCFGVFRFSAGGKVHYLVGSDRYRTLHIRRVAERHEVDSAEEIDLIENNCSDMMRFDLQVPIVKEAPLHSISRIKSVARGEGHLNECDICSGVHYSPQAVGKPAVSCRH